MEVQVLNEQSVSTGMMESCRHALAEKIEQSVPFDVKADILVATGELWTNVCQHQKNKIVSCSVECKKSDDGSGQLRVCLYGVNYVDAPQDNPGAIKKEGERFGGMGLYIVSQLVDSYLPLVDGRGVLLIKKWSSCCS
jgi:anti-sigma regulatory factor (Ser/Thr protein kinase)